VDDPASEAQFCGAMAQPSFSAGPGPVSAGWASRTVSGPSGTEEETCRGDAHGPPGVTPAEGRAFLDSSARRCHQVAGSSGRTTP
jgi:hypothetical protein